MRKNLMRYHLVILGSMMGCLRRSSFSILVLPYTDISMFSKHTEVVENDDLWDLSHTHWFDCGTNKDLRLPLLSWYASKREKIVRLTAPYACRAQVRWFPTSFPHTGQSLSYRMRSPPYDQLCHLLSSDVDKRTVQGTGRVRSLGTDVSS
ncbi:hypothetical protein SCHPADRAFT_705537 [Schizopora paradoxa]|uniref:Uncharacterized protein n=1 Tax=Schizopora paradoxa TaxID=27342 RepID=A0A0H2R2G7_9AGAM|nr:hypothetical protein SCHPADRAFT_705537 [Schizopora paradoxa]